MVLFKLEECIDTPDWKDRNGNNCEYYGISFCESGEAKPGYEGYLGEISNYPEDKKPGKI